ncbi:MAG: FAD:protein FMN transferase [Candidatus Omnitrophica bacterium]|nr:FAD:protein FMN transferase [Candidatus Omnitrophota bacterium]
MGTIVQIKVPLRPGLDKKAADYAIDRAFDEIDRVEKVFSVYRQDSEISRINGLKLGEEMKITTETFSLIERSVEYTKKTSGAFDITVYPLVRLWQDARMSGRLPAVSEIKKALEKVGAANIILDKTKMTISFAKDGVAIDLGGVAKGYATDRAIKVLQEIGIRDAIVNSGGDIYCLGARSKFRPWRVGIRHPRKSSEVFMELDVMDEAVVTSGDYEKYFTLEGRRYSHIIDPRTGYPVGDYIISATVVSEDTVRADMLATALCVLGREGLKIVDSEKAMAAIVVKDGDKMKVEMAGNVRGSFRVYQKKLSQ